MGSLSAISNTRIFKIINVYFCLLIAYALCRLIFIAYNFENLHIEDGLLLLQTFFHGIRFDISAIFYSNLIFTLLFLISAWFTYNTIWKNALKFIFFISNSFFILLNFVDVVYFPFVQKRMQSDALLFLNGQKGYEALGMIPLFIKQFWIVWLLLIVILTLLFRYYKVWEGKYATQAHRKSPLIFSIYGTLLILFINIVGMRGGMQLRPITILNAADHINVENAPAVLNSTFSILMTWQNKSLQLMPYFPIDALDDCEKGIHTGFTMADTSQAKKNVVILIVESLSRQYMSYYNGTSKTPFLDSLMQHSLVFNNGFANARESVQGIPAILASIPSLMNDPFIFSRYSTNKINSIASLLKEEGYTSIFFHGAATGTMGFNSFCRSAGFDHYYGREIYPDFKSDFDGSWGIWDHKYLPFTSAVITSLPEPFVASIFTLNSHHPFKLPDEFANTFTSKGHPIISSIKYADYALALFFEAAKKEPWYKNTLFVLTADHIGPNTVEHKSTLDEYRIPIIFYLPNHALSGQSEKIASQIDIMPTILGYLNARTSYFSLGNNLLSDDCQANNVNYKMGLYQFIDSTHCLQYDGKEVKGLFEWKKDTLLKYNLSSERTDSTILKKLLKTIQVFNQTIIEDKMTYKNIK